MKATCSQHGFLVVVDRCVQDELTRQEIELNKQNMTA